MRGKTQLVAPDNPTFYMERVTCVITIFKPKLKSFCQELIFSLKRNCDRTLFPPSRLIYATPHEPIHHQLLNVKVKIVAFHSRPNQMGPRV